MSFAAALESSELRLAELADEALDHVVSSTEAALAIGLGYHASAVWLGTVRECLTGSVEPASVLVRSLVDAAILVRWLEANPRLHASMYLAEDDRQRLAGAAAMGELRRRRSWPGGAPPVFDPAEERRLRIGINKVRADAQAQGEPLGRSGSVLPHVEQMASVTEDLWEAYTVAYRIVSPWTHAGGRALAGHAYEERADGVHVVPGAILTTHQVRSLASPTFAHLLASVSRQAGLGIELECDDIRLTLIAWPIEAAAGA